MHSPTTKMAKCRTLLTSFFGGDLVMRFCDNWYTSACLIFLIQILLSAITAATTVQNGLQNVRGRRPRGASNRGCICDLGSLYYQKWIFEAEALQLSI